MLSTEAPQANCTKLLYLLKLQSSSAQVRFSSHRLHPRNYLVARLQITPASVLPY